MWPELPAWVDDLAALGDLAALVWRRLTCPRSHGRVMATGDRLYLRCRVCGYISRGIDVNGRRVRRAWRMDRERGRFARRRMVIHAR
jgi:tRNA(Ile2) C34 agmatinyltransferase TiaS